MRNVLALLAFLVSAYGASAQEVNPCYSENGNSYIAQIRAIAEPWEENTRVFGNGSVRIAILDTWDPANYAFHLAIMFTPSDWIEAEGRNCLIVSDEKGLGFQNMTLLGMGSSYDPARGLIFTIKTERYNSDDESVTQGALNIVVNRATNQVTASFE